MRQHVAALLPLLLPAPIRQVETKLQHVAASALCNPRQLTIARFPPPGVLAIFPHKAYGMLRKFGFRPRSVLIQWRADQISGGKKGKADKFTYPVRNRRETSAHDQDCRP